MDPSLFKINVQRKHLEHLQRDDLDEISRFEVVYKVLKDQLRLHQKRLIELKEKDKQQKMAKSPSKERKDVNFKEFVKHVKPFEFYGCQRDLAPELKRIVKNLSCQEHKYLYCPCCKQYEEQDYDPIENLNKFMKFIKDLHEKENPTKQKERVQKRHPLLPDDSISEVTDLEEEVILAKYYGDKLTNIEKRRKDRSEAQKRLLGGTTQMKHKCKPIHKKGKGFEFMKSAS